MSHVRTIDVALVDLFKELSSPRVWEDPYPFYRRLADNGPIFRTADGRFVAVGYDKCLTVLKDSRWERFPDLTCMSDKIFEASDAGGHSASGSRRPQVLQGVPSRKRLREQFSKDFTPAKVRRLRQRIEQIANELIDEMLDAGQVDFIEAFAVPLPVLVLAEVLGAPEIDRSRFKEWSYTLIRASDAGFLPTRPDDAESDRVSQEASAYMSSLIAERRKRPKDDLLSRIISLEKTEGWTEEEIIGIVVTILVAGHHTTTDLLGNGMLALLRDQGQLSRFRTDPAITVPAVEELLRYDAPTQFSTRHAIAELELEGEQVGPGDMAVLILGAANRDPAVFTDPDRLDLTRDPNPHLAFSSGHAYCFGAPLACLEGQVAFSSLAERVPGLALDGEPKQLDTVGLRGLGSLPVTVS